MEMIDGFMGERKFEAAKKVPSDFEFVIPAKREQLIEKPQNGLPR
jgi:hypothetical protein